MTDIPMYHEGRGAFRTASTPAASPTGWSSGRTPAFSDKDREFIESRPMFFLATADAEGRPDCSYKGGRPGFVRVVDPTPWPSRAMTATACSRASATCS